MHKEKNSGLFLRIADAVSFGMGTPTNIFFWLLAAAIWFVLGWHFSGFFVNGSFLPAWFTSSAWNFPLNTITTLMELYIGFLVAAAANRAERTLMSMIQHTLENSTTLLNLHLNMVKQEERAILLEKQVLKLDKNTNRLIREILVNQQHLLSQLLPGEDSDAGDIP